MPPPPRTALPPTRRRPHRAARAVLLQAARRKALFARQARPGCPLSTSPCFPTRAARATISPDDPQSQKPKTETPPRQPASHPARPCSPITSGGPAESLLEILPRQPAATSWCASCTTIPRPENTKVRHLRDTHRRSEPYALPTGVSGADPVIPISSSKSLLRLYRDNSPPKPTARRASHPTTQQTRKHKSETPARPRPARPEPTPTRSPAAPKDHSR